MRLLILLSLSGLLGGCGAGVPITFYGQSFDEYVSESSNNYNSYPTALQQRWQLVSINNDSAPLGAPIANHNFFIYFRATQTGKDRYQFGGKAMQGFWGEYCFNEQGFIEILMMKGIKKTYSGSAGRLERLFERILINAKTYEIVGGNLKLCSSNDELEFELPKSGESR